MSFIVKILFGTVVQYTWCRVVGSHPLKTLGTRKHDTVFGANSPKICRDSSGSTHLYCFRIERGTLTIKGPDTGTLGGSERLPETITDRCCTASLGG